MTHLNLLLAAVLLTGPDASTHPELFPVVGKAIVQLALAGDILDPREAPHFMVKQDDFIADLRILRQRHRELRDAPPVYHAYRFPERETVNELLIFNRYYRQHLDATLEFFPSNRELRAARAETELLYQIWDAVRDARCE